MSHPVIIQGGMGVAVSTWPLARAVALAGQMGVVSGTALAPVLCRRLADGDSGGHLRRALASFPLAEAGRAGPVSEILTRYYIPGGKPRGAPLRKTSLVGPLREYAQGVLRASSGQAYPPTPAYTVRPARLLDRLTALAAYVEVWLAKEGHSGPVGINLLTKVQLPTLATLYGAMLAGVDYVLMGAGIPTHIPAILDALATHQPVSQRIDVEGQAAGDDTRLHFDPEAVFPDLARRIGPLRRPRFLPIVASVALAQALLKRSEGAIDGYVVEGPTAGGHNAPPRGPLHLNERGEPVYGERDIVDPVRMAALGLPFWLGGGYGHPSKVREALDAGAAGVQVGTAFALCDESGLDAELKARLLRRALAGEAEVLTSAVASPTGFPFKVARLEGTLSEAEVYAARPRTCDLGYLRTVVRREDGRLAYRCPAEPVADYVRKGGAAEDTVGRLCLCNALLASAGFPQVRGDGSVEPPVITMGDDLATVGEFVTLGRTGYSAAEVIARLVGAEGDLSS